jgi:hypothetical protein
MTQTYADEEFIEAIDSMTDTHTVAARVGCSKKTAHRRLYDLAQERPDEVAFMHRPRYRSTTGRAVVVDPDTQPEIGYTDPEDWRAPLDE